MTHITVLGDGAWGTALAGLAREGGHTVSVWSRKQPNLESLHQAEAVIYALPAQIMGETLPRLPIPSTAALIITAKGIDRHSHRFMHQVAQAAMPENPVLILSGPSFAEDVSRRLPTAVALAADSIKTSARWAKALSKPHFRIYPSNDLLGVAMGGSLKNVLAIACGISDGKQLGASARAALISRGFSEVLRLGQKLGAKTETLMGLSGFGDLLLTCTSPQSRNYAFGRHLGEGHSLEAALQAASGVVEGLYTAQAVMALAAEHDLPMPITEAITGIVERRSNPDDIIKALLARPVGSEFF
jgi:glycerol-3-phosphate dehydrogenase (NAD(P)+)